MNTWWWVALVVVVLLALVATVSDARGRQSFLETDELRDVAVSGFRRKAGDLDPEVWGQVRGRG